MMTIVFILINEDDDKSKGTKYIDSNHFILPVIYRREILEMKFSTERYLHNCY